MRKARNSDDNIRQLERIYAASRAQEDLIRLWKAQLRAGIIPKAMNQEVAEDSFQKVFYWCLYSGPKLKYNFVVFWDKKDDKYGITYRNQKTNKMEEYSSISKALNAMIDDYGDLNGGY